MARHRSIEIPKRIDEHISLPFRRAGSSGRNHDDEAPGEHDQDLPDQHEQVPEEDEPLGEEPSPEQTLSQPGQERFDAFTQAGQSGDQEEAAHALRRRATTAGSFTWSYETR